MPPSNPITRKNQLISAAGSVSAALAAEAENNISVQALKNTGTTL
jgi:hypothetical protein